MLFCKSNYYKQYNFSCYCYYLYLKVRLWMPPGRLGQTDLAIRLLPRLIDWYENTSGIRYPLEKIGK